MTRAGSPRPQTTGPCRLCGQVFSRRGMGRHLRVCRTRHGAARPAVGNAGLLLAVEDRYLPDYWLYLETAATATWADLDGFLRRTWVECCGHLSEFEYESVHYGSDDVGEFADRTMSGRLARTVQPGVRFRYRYDFGTTTELVLRALTSVDAPRRGPKVQLLARNDPPERLCSGCGQPATQVCAQCFWDGEAWLCDRCVPDHPCGDEMLLPVVNSPRVGICGYTGPDEMLS